MYARVATFESDPSTVDDAIAMVREEVAGDTPAGLEGAKMLMLVDRETGKGVGITLFESEDAMRRGDEALNAMSPGGSERRVDVESDEEAAQYRVLGSPTVLVDGRDVDPEPMHDGFSAEDRLYRTPRGPCGWPEAEWIRDALLRAVAQTTSNGTH